MGHYTGPKGRINRRLGVMVYESAGAVKALERRDYSLGMQGVKPKRGKLSTYSLGLLEKQKLRHAYGLGERALRRLFQEARRRRSNAGIVLLRLCELQLHCVINREGMTKTRSQARQGVVHGHFLVNGRKVDRPTFRVCHGDVITVKRRQPLIDLYLETTAEADRQPSSWLGPDPDNLRIDVLSYPPDGEVVIPIDMGLVVEFLSR